MEAGDLQELVSFILKEGRGDSSREYVSRNSPFTIHQIKRWEREGKSIKVDDFFLLLKLYKVEFQEVVSSFFTTYNNSYEMSPLSFIKAIIPHTTNKTVQSLSQWSSSKVQRVMTGEQELYAWEFFYLIEKVPGYLWVLVEGLLKGKALGPYQTSIEKTRNILELLRNEPYVGIFVNIINSKPYDQLNEHHDSYISDFLGISLEKVQSVLTIMEELKMIIFNNEKKKYEGHKRVLPITSLTDDEQRDLVAFHANRNAQYIQSKEFLAQNAVFSYANFLLSSRQVEEVRQEFTAFYTRVFSIANRKNQELESLYSMQLYFYNQDLS